MVSGLPAEKGCEKVIISYMIQPRDQISAFSVYGYDLTISGHEYKIVPTKDFITDADCVPHRFANPKSASLIFNSSPDINTLPGAKSLCTILFSTCKYRNAAASYMKTYHTTDSLTLCRFSL
jgi:hypothetical protein